MSGIGSNPTAEEIAAKEAQERLLKTAQVSDLVGRAPSRTPSNVDSSDDSSSDSDSDSDSDSSDEDVKDDDHAAKKATKMRRKAKKKKKAKKMAKKLLKKMIKKEQAKYTHSGFYEVPQNYGQIPVNNSTTNSIPCIWESLLISMGRIIPNGLMICKCTSTAFTLLFGRLWL
jgi:hypothetical protein